MALVNMANEDYAVLIFIPMPKKKKINAFCFLNAFNDLLNSRQCFL